MNLHALPLPLAVGDVMMAGIFLITTPPCVETLNMFKKILFPLVALFMLAGCATPPTTIDVSPKITLPQQDPSLMGVTDVSQGNVRYNIATKADIAIVATAANGNKMTKNYRASYSVEGAFQASNKNIADAVNSVMTDTISDMAQDTSIHDFIKQNAR